MVDRGNSRTRRQREDGGSNRGRGFSSSSRARHSSGAASSGRSARQSRDLPASSAGTSSRKTRSAPRVQVNARSSGNSREFVGTADRVSRASESQDAHVARNLWEIGDNPSPESGYSYVSTRRGKPTPRRASATRSPQPANATPRAQIERQAHDSAAQDSAAAPAELTSERVGDIRDQERAKRLRAASRRYFIRVFVAIGIVVALLAGWAALYNSPVFSIEDVTVKGVEHLTGDEMAQLANVPADTTLLRVDVDAIAERVRQNSWVQDVQVNRIFPNTLEIDVTERPVAAIVEIPVSQGSEVKQWAIADDHTWLMPIPDANSDAAKTTSSKIYEDVETVRHIVGVPYGTKAEIGQVCSDDNVNNALDIIGGMTTDLAGRIVKVSAPGIAETTLVLDNGVEIAFGKAEDIRDKERVIQKILDENHDAVAYINVRMVENPTWRAI